MAPTLLVQTLGLKGTPRAFRGRVLGEEFLKALDAFDELVVAKGIAQADITAWTKGFTGNHRNTHCIQC